MAISGLQVAYSIRGLVAMMGLLVAISGRPMADQWPVVVILCLCCDHFNGYFVGYS